MKIAFTRLAAFLWFTALLSGAAEKPNIVYILADDLGWGDLDCYNHDSAVPTPYANRFAEQGVRFTDMHSPSSVCTPTRYGILTGRYFSRHLISGKEVDLVPGDKFRERTAYVLFKCSKDRPVAELLDWATKIRKAAL